MDLGVCACLCTHTYLLLFEVATNHDLKISFTLFVECQM